MRQRNAPAPTPTLPRARLSPAPPPPARRFDLYVFWSGRYWILSLTVNVRGRENDPPERRHRFM